MQVRTIPRTTTTNTEPSHFCFSCAEGCSSIAGLAQLSDRFVSDPDEAFSKDQSVRAQVVQVSRELSP